jgi:hypothetical protein
MGVGFAGIDRIREVHRTPMHAGPQLRIPVMFSEDLDS